LLLLTKWFLGTLMWGLPTIFGFENLSLITRLDSEFNPIQLYFPGPEFTQKACRWPIPTNKIGLDHPITRSSLVVSQNHTCGEVRGESI